VTSDLSVSLGVTVSSSGSFLSVGVTSDISALGATFSSSASALSINATSDVSCLGVNATSDIEASGRLKASGGLVDNVEASSGPGDTLLAYGVSTITSASSGTTYTLANPVVGLHKTIFAASISNTSEWASVIISGATGSTGITFDGSNRRLVFGSAGQVVQLIAQTCERWLIVSSTDQVSSITTT